MSRAVRVRFAPSPTGFLHIGGLRTALYNYCFARKNGGKFILRIEDTDQTRLVPGSVESLIAALRWCGIEFDEGPGKEGPYGPYVQSERLKLYSTAAERLLSGGHAYRCFCSPERLDELRKSQSKRGRTPLYDRTCTKLSAQEAERRAAAGERYVIRLLVPPGSTSFRDAVRGSVTFNNADVDDQVLLKSDGWPTYHLASVVDDTAMDISHVIRGQEWLPSTPKHLMLYAAMGVPPPTFAHLPILLNPDRSKLSKRSGDASVEDFKRSGYTARALTHFVALLGWTPPSGQGEAGRGDNVGLLDLPSLSSTFTLESVHKGDSIVDRAKLDSLNAEHIRLGMTEALERSTTGKQGSLLPVQLDDTPFLSLLRSEVVPRIDAAYREVMAGQQGGSVCSRVSVERFNAMLLAQHERVRPLPDFVDLVLPFLLRAGVGEEWGRWLARPQAQGAAGKIVASMSKKKAVGGAEPAVPAPVSDLSSIRGPIQPALEAITAAWAALPQEEWLAVEACSTSSSSSGESVPLATAKAAAKAAGVPAGKLLLPLRFLLTGLDVGAGMGDTCRLLGREECVARVQQALAVKAQAQARGTEERNA